jgi:hypothetical protein
MKWWQKKVRGWIVPFWYTDTPLVSKRVAELSLSESNLLADNIRASRHLKAKPKPFGVETLVVKKYRDRLLHSIGLVANGLQEDGFPIEDIRGYLISLIDNHTFCIERKSDKNNTAISGIENYRGELLKEGLNEEQISRLIDPNMWSYLEFAKAYHKEKLNALNG